MEELLFLAHRIPYPPDKGDKIRSWNILKHLAGRYRIRLGCLIDDPHDRQYVPELARICAEVMAVPIAPRRQRLVALLKTRPGQPLSTGYFQTPALTRWVRRTLAQNPICKAFVYSTPMMALLPAGDGLETILDLVDVDSEKWRQMADKSGWPKSWIYAREARTLLAFERAAAARARHALLSSQAEAALFVARAPEVAGHTRAMGNGVDLDYFSPVHRFDPPFAADRPAIVFTGDMSYWPNIEAVAWFARQVMPRLAARDPRPRFAIVGARPAEAVRALAGPDIVVTGRVPDVRPYLAHAACVVAPLQLARGVQNKVLEAMAMAKVVVATSAAEQGLDVRDAGAILIADDPVDMALRIAETLDAQHDRVGPVARRCVETRFGWPAMLAGLDRLMDGGE